MHGTRQSAPDVTTSARDEQSIPTHLCLARGPSHALGGLLVRLEAGGALAPDGRRRRRGVLLRRVAHVHLRHRRRLRRGHGTWCAACAVDSIQRRQHRSVVGGLHDLANLCVCMRAVYQANKRAGQSPSRTLYTDYLIASRQGLRPILGSWIQHIEQNLQSGRSATSSVKTLYYAVCIDARSTSKRESAST